MTSYNIAMCYWDKGDRDTAIAYMERCVRLDAECQHPDLASDRATLERWKRIQGGG